MSRNDPVGVDIQKDVPSDLDRAGRSPLHYAARDGDIGLVLELIQSGADVKLADVNGWTPLHLTAQQQRVPAILALIAAGAVVDAQDKFGNTPLNNAVFSSRGKGDAIKALRAAHADAPEDLAGDLIQPGHPLFGIVWVNPQRMSGTPCFSGTRVPVASLFDHLEAGDSLDVFLEDSPPVTHEQAVALLEISRSRLLDDLVQS